MKQYKSSKPVKFDTGDYDNFSKQKQKTKNKRANKKKDKFKHDKFENFN